MLRPLIFTSLLSVCGLANAVVLTFDEIAGQETIQTSIDSGGYHFVSNHMHTYGSAGWDLVASNGTTHLGYESGRGAPITMTRQDGGTFSLLSLDASEFYPNNGGDRPNAQYLSILGTWLDGATATYELVLDSVFADGTGGVVDFEHFTLPALFTNVSSIVFTGMRFEGRDGGFAIDNLDVETGGVVVTPPDSTHVPEPGTLALLGMGLLGMGAARRRKV